MANLKGHLGSRPPTSRLRAGFIAAVLIGGLTVAVVIIALAMRSDPATTSSLSAPTSSSTAEGTTTTIEEREEVISHLRTILSVRDRAYRERDIDLLKEVYTVDCPCLKGDGRAIRQLLKDDAVWVGATTSVRVQEFEKVNDRLWIVVADFIGSPFRIETESGDLIRAVEGRSELFRFALARLESDKLLLGFAAPVDESD